MAIEWVVGSLKSVSIEWMCVEGIAPVSNKELLTVRFEARTTDEAYGYIYFDNFGLFRNLTNDKTLGNYIVYLPIEVGTTGLPVFGALRDCHIAAAHLVPKEQITGSSEDPMQLILRNVETDEIICTKTFGAGINALAYEVTPFGPAHEEHKELNLGGGVRFEVDGTGSIPEMLLVIEWNLS